MKLVLIILALSFQLNAFAGNSKLNEQLPKICTFKITDIPGYVAPFRTITTEPIFQNNKFIGQVYTITRFESKEVFKATHEIANGKIISFDFFSIELSYKKNGSGEFMDIEDYEVLIRMPQDNHIYKQLMSCSN